MSNHYDNNETTDEDRCTPWRSWQENTPDDGKLSIQGLDPRDPYDNALIKPRSISHGKRQDYTSGDNIFENFERAAKHAGVGVDTVFDVMTGIKIARLEALRARGGEPNFESIEDTYVDLINYLVLKRAWGMQHPNEGNSNG